MQSSTIYSNFIDGLNSVGLVTSTGNTQIVNGVTTVNAIRVFGTYLPGGKYAQVKSSEINSLPSSIKQEGVSPVANLINAQWL